MNTLIALSCLLAICSTGLAYAYGGYGGGLGGYGGGGYGGGEEYGPSNYKFEYGVSDPHTGDKKQQHEVREGDHVKGAYSFKEADGTTRVVEYFAGPHSGFNAVVKRIGHAYHPQHYGHGGAQGGGYGGGFGGGYGGAHSYVGPTNFGYKY